MRFLMIVLLLSLSLTPAPAAVQGTVAMCGADFCITLTATSGANAPAPDHIEITVPIGAALFSATTTAPCSLMSFGDRTFVACDLVVWKDHPASMVIRLAPVVYSGSVWITPSAYVFDPVDPSDLVIEPILVPVPIHTHLPVVRR